MVVAYFFGAGMATDAFFVAFRIPNLWRRLVGEGSMTVSFIPVYTEYLTQRTKKESQEVTHIAFTIAGDTVVRFDSSWNYLLSNFDQNFCSNMVSQPRRNFNSPLP